ncbi:hypothetical protein F5Y06DRAFT_302399 [Hypoxylon sp. FL0890]|nr:hypothetical protein F5Y06DRAFT_302399 [Hypoxylon sp. FL0890]
MPIRSRGDIAGSNDVMDPGHKGPVMAYLKKVSDATKDGGGTDTVINKGGNQQIKIPDCIEDGRYLLRAEMIALHGARSANGARLYSNDPGLLIDIYNKPPGTSNPYKIPGPPVFTC